MKNTKKLRWPFFQHAARDVFFLFDNSQLLNHFWKTKQGIIFFLTLSKLPLWGSSKHEVMSSCLVRQGREVEEGIGSLQANLRYSEARIKGMYKEVFMQQQGYCLHTKMVHKGNTSTTQVISSFTVINLSIYLLEVHIRSTI